MKKLLIWLNWPTESRLALEQALEGRMEPVYREGAGEGAFSDGLLGEVAAVLGNPSLELLGRCPSLEWVQLGSAGAEDYAAGLPEGVALTNATGAYGPAIGEYQVGMTFALLKKLHLYRDQQREARWKDLGLVKGVAGSRTLVVGLGDLGSQYAWRMSALGAHVIGICRTPREKPDYVEALFQLEALDRLLPEMDIVSLCLPNTPETRKLFSAERIARMKEGAILLNVGRGTAVDLEALADALESGRLWGAALDVTDPEPLPPEHRLWRIPNALITPHISGGEHMKETGEAIRRICLDNLGRYLRGERLENRVSRNTGYRVR